MRVLIVVSPGLEGCSEGVESVNAAYVTKLGFGAVQFDNLEESRSDDSGEDPRECLFEADASPLVRICWVALVFVETFEDGYFESLCL